MRKAEEVVKQQNLVELSNFKKLCLKAKRWQQTIELRNYIDAVSQKVQSESRQLPEKIVDWLKWANKKTDWYDPLIEAEDETLQGINRDTLTISKEDMV